MLTIVETGRVLRPAGIIQRPAGIGLGSVFFRPFLAASHEKSARGREVRSTTMPFNESRYWNSQLEHGPSIRDRCNVVACVRTNARNRRPKSFALGVASCPRADRGQGGTTMS